MTGAYAEPSTRRRRCWGRALSSTQHRGHLLRAADWSGTGRTQLWTYNLLLDDLNAADAGTRRAWHERLIERWIDENLPGSGTGWDAYPASRRVVNWIKWLLRRNVAAPKTLKSLGVQARWLNRRIESHLQGNHLIANAQALNHARPYFAGEEATR